MLEDAAGIEFSTSEQTVTIPWKSTYINEDSDQGKNNMRRVIQILASWRIFKIIVFIISLFSVIIQSIEFLKTYYSYPTSIVLEATVRNDFKIPAVTLCFINTVSTETFCRYSSDFCEKPSNLKEFCKKNPIHCRGNTNDLKIPMTGYYTNYSNKLEGATRNYLYHEEFNAKQLFLKTSDIKTPLTRTFIDAYPSAIKCYSDNLHLYQSGLKPETAEIGERRTPFTPSIPNELQRQRTL
ncbi:unnamed protein product [Larinioides sclopetarius]|uniref:Uncharacterized protein n=1 Tax=Larinioides sclopetarius TaxID=280406 RepID=A0AAV2B316_9ARAC